MRNAVANDHELQLDSIVLRALAKNPADRYPSAEAMDADLARAARVLEPRPAEELLALVDLLTPNETEFALLLGLLGVPDDVSRPWEIADLDLHDRESRALDAGARLA